MFLKAFIVLKPNYASNFFDSLICFFDHNVEYISVILKAITIVQSELFRNKKEHPGRSWLLCSEKINEKVKSS